MNIRYIQVGLAARRNVNNNTDININYILESGLDENSFLKYRAKNIKTGEVVHLVGTKNNIPYFWKQKRNWIPMRGFPTDAFSRELPGWFLITFDKQKVGF